MVCEVLDYFDRISVNIYKHVVENGVLLPDENVVVVG